jgi:hypothetical protein
MEGKRVILLSDDDVDWLWVSLNNALGLIDTETYQRELCSGEQTTIGKFLFILVHDLDATIPRDYEFVQSLSEKANKNED